MLVRRILQFLLQRLGERSDSAQLLVLGLDLWGSLWVSGSLCPPFSSRDLIVHVPPGRSLQPSTRVGLCAVGGGRGVTLGPHDGVHSQQSHQYFLSH